MRFVADANSFTSKRLMLNFEKFEISDCNIELTIVGTAGSDVRLFYIILFI